MGIPHEWNFFWGYGTKISFLRYLSMATCRALHPDWPIRLWTCDWSAQNIGWGFGDFQGRQRGHNWLNEAESLLGVEQKIYEPLDQRILGFPPPNISDIFSYDYLGQCGGWYADMDIMFVKPHDDLSDAGYAFIGFGGLEPWVGTFGAVQGSWVMGAMQQECIKNFSADSYNSTGTLGILKGLMTEATWGSRFAAGDNGLKNWAAPSDMFYPVRPQLSGMIWDTEYHTPKPMSWQVHCYGGNSDYQTWNRKLTPEMLWDSGNQQWLMRYVRSVDGISRLVPRTTPTDLVVVDMKGPVVNDQRDTSDQGTGIVAPAEVPGQPSGSDGVSVPAGCSGGSEGSGNDAAAVEVVPDDNPQGPGPSSDALRGGAAGGNDAAAPGTADESGLGEGTEAV